MARKKAETMSYEQALERLEQVVRELEQGDLSLDASLELFQEGVELTRLCSQMLDEAERKIEKLTLDESGRPRLETAQLEEGA
ncbi:MAG: exodeoxyribonuclease VII small subunit [Bacillota bacterium]